MERMDKFKGSAQFSSVQVEKPIKYTNYNKTVEKDRPTTITNERLLFGPLLWFGSDGRIVGLG